MTDHKTQLTSGSVLDLTLDFSLELIDEAAMLEFGNRIAEAIGRGLKNTLKNDCPGKTPEPALLIALQGDLGAGKTTLSRGVLTGLGHSGAVKSPTYTLVEPYDLVMGQVCHFDFYRLQDPEELEYMGFRDYLVESRLCLIEWPERGAGFLPEVDILVEIVQLNEGRKVTLSGKSQQARVIISQLDRETYGVSGAD
ncbi:MAG: tRNA (adenosine(37)-N6)-threonylcarbamoyltransferase complex ATPase subunit type 1 TsaE [Porticoccaceae bacterium]|nr:tRNA (adenosine(37)-N6)-threonylcarbamoyltransferase complex ATPase subunit type 1 TsaE [Porticoccaceae bacterium]